jgi:hypothetical protein
LIVLLTLLLFLPGAPFKPSFGLSGVVDFDFVFVLDFAFAFAFVLALVFASALVLAFKCHPERSGRASACEVEGPLPIL